MRHQKFRNPAWRGYALAVVAFLVAFGLRYGLAHWFPPGFPYLTFFPAVVLVAFYAGLRPAILTATLSGLSAWWFWIGPPGFDLGVATFVAIGFYAFVVNIDWKRCRFVKSRMSVIDHRNLLRGDLFSEQMCRHRSALNEIGFHRMTDGFVSEHTRHTTR